MATVKKAMVKKAAKAAPKMMKKAAPMMSGGSMMKMGGKLKKAEDGYGPGDKKKPATDSTPKGYVRGEMTGKLYKKEVMDKWEKESGQALNKALNKTKPTPAPKKKMKSGGSFPDLNKDGKITQKDILIGKGVLPKTAKKGMKVKKASFGDFMKGAIKMGSKIKGAADSARGAIGSAVLGMPGAKPIAKKGMKIKKQAAIAIAMKKAGKAPKKAMSGMSMMKMGGKTKKCKYGCK